MFYLLFIISIAANLSHVLCLHGPANMHEHICWYFITNNIFLMTLCVLHGLHSACAMTILLTVKLFLCKANV